MKQRIAVLALLALASGCGGGGSTPGAATPPLPNAGPNSGTAAGPQATFHVPKFTIVDLGPNVFPSAINNNGTVVGTQNNVAVEFTNGALHQLGMLPGDTQSAALDVNDSGQIVGSSNTPASTTASHAVLFTGSGIQDLGGPPQLTYRVATAINNNGEIVGYATDDISSSGATCAQLVIFTPPPLKTPTSLFAEPHAVNGSGEIVGGACVGLFLREVPFAYPQTAVFPPFGGFGPEVDYHASDINDANQIVGVFHDQNGVERGFLVKNFTTDITIPGLNGDLSASSTSDAEAINSNGIIVGSASSASSGPRAMLYANGTVYDLNSFTTGPGCALWFLQNATDINNSNTIVGFGTLNGQTHGFMLVPQ